MAINSLSTGFRPGVCTSSTRPTAPYIGQHIYENDTLLEYVWNGSIWVRIYTANATTKGDIETYSTAPARLPVGTNNQILTANSATATGLEWQTNTSGLVYLGTSTFSGTTNNVTSIFSATYDSYRIVISNMTIGAAGYFSFRMLSGTTSLSTATYYSAARGFDSNGTARDLNAAGASIGYIQTYFSAAQTNAGSVTMDIVNPFATKVTFFTMQSSNYTYGGYTSHNGSVAIDNTTSYDGLQFLQHVGGTTVGGTIRVYGYRQ